MVNSYNGTRHSFIKMTPAKASLKENEKAVWMNLFGSEIQEAIEPKFSIGDKVRITKKKNTFEKGYRLRLDGRRKFLQLLKFNTRIRQLIKLLILIVKKYKAHFMNSFKSLHKKSIG